MFHSRKQTPDEFPELFKILFFTVVITIKSGLFIDVLETAYDFQDYKCSIVISLLDLSISLQLDFVVFYALCDSVDC